MMRLASSGVRLSMFGLSCSCSCSSWSDMAMADLGTHPPLKLKLEGLSQWPLPVALAQSVGYTDTDIG